MKSSGVRYFTSLTHGISTDCRQANAKIKETLEDYNFGSYLIENTCCRCPNDDCNLSFIFILQEGELLRLKRSVQFSVRPTFLMHTTFKELLAADRQIRQRLRDRNTVGIQVGADMVNKYVDACPPTCNMPCQTDFMVGKRDTGGQTEEVIRNDAECQVTPEQPALSVTVVQQSDCQPAELNFDVSTSLSFIDMESSNPPPIRTAEVQQDEDEDEDDDDDDILFIEVRPRNPDVPTRREIKREEPVQEETVQESVEPMEPEREVKEEPVEDPAAVQLAEQQVASTAASNTIEESSLTVAQCLEPFFDRSPSSPMPSIPMSPSFLTPNTSMNDSIESIFGSAVKRPKMSDMQMCKLCYSVFFDTELEDYISHILEVHVSVHRFKCNECGRKFGSFVSANNHARIHSDPEQGELVISEISEEHLHKFIRVSNQCFPSKFEMIPSEEIAEMIKKLR